MIGLVEVIALIFFLFGALSDRHRKVWWSLAAVLAFIALVNTP